MLMMFFLFCVMAVKSSAELAGFAQYQEALVIKELKEEESHLDDNKRLVVQVLLKSHDGEQVDVEKLYDISTNNDIEAQYRAVAALEYFKQKGCNADLVVDLWSIEKRKDTHLDIMRSILLGALPPCSEGYGLLCEVIDEYVSDSGVSSFPHDISSACVSYLCTENPYKNDLYEKLMMMEWGEGFTLSLFSYLVDFLDICDKDSGMKGKAVLEECVLREFSSSTLSFMTKKLQGHYKDTLSIKLQQLERLSGIISGDVSFFNKTEEPIRINELYFQKRQTVGGVIRREGKRERGHRAKSKD